MTKYLAVLCFFYFLAQSVFVVDSIDGPVSFEQSTRVYEPSKDRILTFVRKPILSFAEAVAACASHGDVLAEFRDTDDINFVNTEFKKGSMIGLQDSDYIYAGAVYIGPASAEFDGDSTKNAPKAYQWFESGTTVTNWGPGQPNKLVGNGWDEDCVVLYKVGKDRGWAVGDHTCASRRPFICSTHIMHV